MRLMLALLMMCLWLVSASSEAATTVVAETIAANLAARLVGNAPPGNITVSGVPVAITAATQSGLVNNTVFGTVNLTALNLPATGIMLTTGSIAGGSNAIASAGDVDVETAIAGAAASTSDAATLQFSFTVAAGMTHVSLDMIFATQEVLGLAPAVRDAVVVLVDGVNVAKFVTPDPASTLMSNINTTSIFPAAPLGTIITGFDNVSQRQVVLAPLLVQPTHTIKVAIADHVDGLRDSAVLMANMRALIPAPATTPVAGTGVAIAQGTGVGVSPTPNWLAPNPNPLPDTVAPRVRLIGNATVDVMQNALYIDQGAIAIDNVDGNLTGAIVTTNTVNTAIPATYTVTYNVNDFATPVNAGVATRTVIVHPTSIVDVLPPVVTPPADILLTATDFEGVLSSDIRLAAFLAAGTAVDNAVLLGGGQAPFDPATLPAKLPIGKTLVTFAALDSVGNKGTAQATVTVIGTNQTKDGIDAELPPDGIPDAWEIAVFGVLTTATAVSDFDLDGLSDLLEWQLGTNPKLKNTNAASVSTDSWGVVFSNNPSDSDGDGVIDVLEDATSVTTASRITGLPVSVNSTVKYTIDTGGPALDQAHVSPIGAGAPANVSSAFGVLSFRVNSGAVNLPVRITSSVPFGNSPQFYKVNAAGVYSLIPLNNINIVSSTVVDIIMTDGGALDLDGTVNGVIVDPIAIGNAPQILGGSGSGGGGCSVVYTRGIFDPIMPLMLLLSLCFLFQSRMRARGD